VFVVCSAITTLTFCGPSDTHLDNLVGQTMFGDEAVVVIIGYDPISQIEKQLFELVWTAQSITPKSDDIINGHLGDMCVYLNSKLMKDILSLPAIFTF